MGAISLVPGDMRWYRGNIISYHIIGHAGPDCINTRSFLSLDAGLSLFSRTTDRDRYFVDFLTMLFYAFFMVPSVNLTLNLVATVYQGWHQNQGSKASILNRGMKWILHRRKGSDKLKRRHHSELDDV